MGILNVTPDSFSDGGQFLDPNHALDAALRMVDEGADIIDVGPESTRPGAAPISPAEQIDRAIPVIDRIRARNDEIVISIDTRQAAVACAALDAGADMINDISALRDDPAMADLAATRKAFVVLMHMRGDPSDMQAGGGPAYDDVVGEITDFLQERVRFAVSAGIDASRIITDPGIGFGKRADDNLTLLRHLKRFVDLGQPVLIGASRKSFIGKTLTVENPTERLAGSLTCALLAVQAGASIVRVHDVRATVQALRMYSALH